MHCVIRQLGLSASIATLIAASGCAMPRHQDAVFFGTDTKVAFDVGVQPENGNTPSLTLGYKRREFVYMPLAEYGPAPQLGVIEAVVAGDFIRGGAASDAPGTAPGADSEKNPVGTRHKYQGDGAGNEKDSYSVFATFGGNFNGASGGGAKIKQVFATGIAAQIAAKNGEEYVSDAAAGASKEKAIADAKNAELETKRLEAAYSPAAFSEREQLKSKIDQLSDENAIKLSTELVSKKLIDPSDIGTLCFNIENCPEFQASDGKAARKFLRRAIESPKTIGDPGQLALWSNALE